MSYSIFICPKRQQFSNGQYIRKGVGNTLSYDKYRHFIRDKSFIRVMTCSITGDVIVSIRRSEHADTCITLTQSYVVLS